MNKDEIYKKIEDCIDELKRKDSEEDAKVGVFLDLCRNKLLHCDACDSDIQGEEVFISDIGKFRKVLCKKGYTEEREVKE